MNKLPEMLFLFLLLTFSSMAALAVDSRDIANYSFYIPGLIIGLWVIKKIFFKNLKVSKWIPITIVLVFLVGAVMAWMASSQDPTEKIAQRMVKFVNDNTPKVLSDDLRMDKGSYEFPAMTVYFTLLKIKPNEIEAQDLMDDIYLSQKKEICDNPDLSDLLNQGIQIIYAYHDNKGNFIMEIDFNKLTCQ